MADRFAFDGFTLLYLRNKEADFGVELTVNHGRKEPYGLGDGYGHLEVAVEDLDADHARFERGGLSPRPVKEMGHGGKPLAKFFFVQDPDGYLIEVLQRQGRYR